MPPKIFSLKRIFRFLLHWACLLHKTTWNRRYAYNTEYFLDAPNTVIASHSDACPCVSLGSSRIVTVYFFPSQSSVYPLTAYTCVGLSECSSVLAMCSITAGDL